MTTQSPSEKLTVFILNLDKEQTYEDLFDNIYSDLIASLDAKYHIQRARSLGEAQSYLNEHQPIAILLLDPAVTLKQNSAVLGQVRNYVQAGGFAIFSCSFSSLSSRLPWTSSGRRAGALAGSLEAIIAQTSISTGMELSRRMFFDPTFLLLRQVNRSVPRLTTSSLPNKYSQKAVFVANVASDDSVYRPSSDSITQSRVFPSEPVNQNEVAIAFTNVGEGWLGLHCWCQ
jgi:hypothetical protein